MHEITFDTTRKLLRLVMIGHWDCDALDRFERERAETLERLGWSSGDYVCLIDLRQHGVQSKHVAEHGQAINKAAERPARRRAVVVSGMLSKLQVARVISGAEERIFTSEEDAMAWLMEPVPSQ